jgi:hypothetical protein
VDWDPQAANFEAYVYNLKLLVHNLMIFVHNLKHLIHYLKICPSKVPDLPNSISGQQQQQQQQLTLVLLLLPLLLLLLLPPQVAPLQPLTTRVAATTRPTITTLPTHTITDIEKGEEVGQGVESRPVQESKSSIGENWKRSRVNILDYRVYFLLEIMARFLLNYITQSVIIIEF